MSIESIVADYQIRTAEARARREERIAAAEADFRTETAEARVELIAALDADGTAGGTTAPPALTEPPASTAPKGTGPDPREVARAALKAELGRLQDELSALAGPTEVRDARMSVGMDADRPLSSSKAKDHTLADYRAELQRRIALLRPAVVSVASCDVSTDTAASEAAAEPEDAPVVVEPPTPARPASPVVPVGDIAAMF